VVNVSVQPADVKAPDVNVTVPQPNVLVDAPVTVNVPAQVAPAQRSVKVKRDAEGKITGFEPGK
jgi:hypothetical protein